MAGWLAEKPRSMFYGSAFFVSCTEIETPDPGERDCTGTHGARLKGYIEIALGQPLTSERGAGCADHEDFGMGGRIAQLKGSVSVRSQDCLPLNQHCADWHFAACPRQFSLPQSLGHEPAAACPGSVRRRRGRVSRHVMKMSFEVQKC